MEHNMSTDDEFKYELWEEKIKIACYDVVRNKQNNVWWCDNIGFTDAKDRLHRLIARGSGVLQHAREEMIPDRGRMSTVQALAEAVLLVA
jgi:hypothetical protein